MDCNLTDKERSEKGARCRSFDCQPCKEYSNRKSFYSNVLNEEINRLEKENKKLQGKLKDAVEVIRSIKRENHDDKTQIRYIESLKKWQDKTCKKAWEFLAKIKESE